MRRKPVSKPWPSSFSVTLSRNWTSLPRNLTRALQQYVAHYHEERNHQGKQNRLLFPLPNRGASEDNGIVRCKERLGGLLKYYEREAE